MPRIGLEHAMLTFMFGCECKKDDEENDHNIPRLYAHKTGAIKKDWEHLDIS